MTIKRAIIESIRDSWAGEEVPHPYSNEYARGQFELAIQLLSYNGADTMEDAVLTLHSEVAE